MALDYQTLVICIFAGAAGLFAAFRYVKSCNSPLCSCQQDTPTIRTPHRELTYQQEKITRPNPIRPIAIWSNNTVRRDDRDREPFQINLPLSEVASNQQSDERL